MISSAPGGDKTRKMEKGGWNQGKSKKMRIVLKN